MGRVARLGIVAQRPRSQPPGVAGRLADRPPVDRQSLHAPRRAALGPARVPARRGRRAGPGRRPRARPDDPRPVPAPLRDRRGPADRTGQAGCRGHGWQRLNGSRSRSSVAAPPAHSWPPGWPGPGTTSSSWSGRRRGTGGRAGSSRRRPSVAALRRAGLAAPVLAAVTRPIPAMRVETPRRHDVPPDLRRRCRRRAGGRLRPIEPRPGAARARPRRRRAGADRLGGRRRRSRARPARRAASGRAGRDRGATSSSAPTACASVVARAARVDRPARLAPRLGLTYHLADPGRSAARDARMRIVRDGYVGIAPVPGDRVNVGIVLGRSWQDEVARDGARAVADRLVAAIPPADDDPAAWRDGPPLDTVAGAWPVGHRVTRRAGPTLAPGRRRGRVPGSVHRGGTPSRARLGRAGRRGHRRAVPRSSRRLRRLRAGDDPPVPGEGRRLVAGPGRSSPARRSSNTPPAGSHRGPTVRATMGLVMGDLIPAGRALDPRYLAALLAP